MTFESLPHSTFLLFIGAFSMGPFCGPLQEFLASMDPVVTNIFTTDLGAVLLGLADLTTGRFHWPLSMGYLSIVLCASVGASSIGITVWFYLLEDEEAAALSYSGLALSLVSFLFGWLLLREAIESVSILGSIPIVVGVYLVNKQAES